MKPINTAYKWIWMIEMLPRNTKCTGGAKHSKI